MNDLMVEDVELPEEDEGLSYANLMGMNAPCKTIKATFGLSFKLRLA